MTDVRSEPLLGARLVPVITLERRRSTGCGAKPRR